MFLKQRHEPANGQSSRTLPHLPPLSGSSDQAVVLAFETRYHVRHGIMGDTEAQETRELQGNPLRFAAADRVSGLPSVSANS